MKLEIIPCVKEMGCYICGSKNIAAVCHHCGRVMCADHKTFSIPASRFYNHVENYEFADLSLPETVEQETAVHCEDCLHYTVTYEPSFYIMVAVGFVFIWAALLVSTVKSMILLAILGTAYIVVGIWGVITEHDYRSFKIRTTRSPLPFWGRFPSANLNETVVGNVILDANGVYQVTAEKSTGVFNFYLSLTESDEIRLSQYRQKHRLGNSENIAFHAGFAVLQGIGRLQMKNISNATNEINPIRLTGHTTNLPALNTVSHGKRWEYRQNYAFALDNQHTTGLPVQIIPSLLSEGDEWGLELNIQINPHLNTSSLSRPVVTRLELATPYFSGGVENFMPSAETTREIATNRQIVNWQNITFGPTKNKIFYVRFANSRKIRPDFQVQGKLSMEFEGSIAELTNIILFSPFGQNLTMQDANIRQKSEVQIRFHFNLAALCLRQFYPQNYSIEQLTAIPSNEMVTRLVNALNNKGLYVQRVIENPPQMNWANAHIMNRMWVIAGRRYKEATPIDFRVVAVGQEQYEDSDTPHDGKTQFEITTQGTVIREDMRIDIECLRNDIVKVIQLTPDLEVNLLESKLYANEWCELVGTVQNTGQTAAKDISILVEGVKTTRADNVDELAPGDIKQFKLHVFAENSGSSVPVLVVVTCKDEFGQLPPQRKRQQLHVKEKPATSTFSHQTNFYGPPSGSIHTGSGDIGRSDQ